MASYIMSNIMSNGSYFYDHPDHTELLISPRVMDHIFMTELLISPSQELIRTGD